MSDLLQVINMVAQQTGSISKETLKALYEEYKITYKD
jgi:hypothetical protein